MRLSTGVEVLDRRAKSSGREVLVVGGGAAGLIAAKRAAECGAQVTLLEKNDRLGMKILISGGGKCNLTHAGSMEEIRACFRPPEARFLKPSFYRFTNDDFLAILHASGMQTYVRPDGRIFPVEPANAKDVVAALEEVVRAAGVRVVIGAAVTGLVVEEGQIAGVRVGERIRRAERVVLAVGGSSYPATGTTGDGWRWAAEVGHTMVPLRAALAPHYLESVEPDWSGVALRDVTLRARAQTGGKEYIRWRGDLLFTHKGLSGPCALGVSREIAERMAVGLAQGGVLEVDLIPDTSFEDLQAQMRTELRDSPRKTVGSIVDRYLPDRLTTPFLAMAGVEAQTRGAHLSAKALNQLVNRLKGWPLGGVRSVPLERGEVVAGGICLDEVDPQTMASRVVPGLLLCGEILDIAGPVGGYNLQAAWSTGFVAGEAAVGNIPTKRP
jgi:predicted Rossmann fold flavoprotein